MSKKKAQVFSKLSKVPWTISIQMYLCLSVFVFLTVLTSFFSGRSLSEITGIQKALTEKRIPQLSLAISIGQSISDIVNATPKLFLAQDQAEISKTKNLINNDIKKLKSDIEQIKNIRDDSKDDLSEKITQNTQEFLENLNKIESSLIKTVQIRSLVDSTTAQLSEKINKSNQLLATEIDELSFFLQTGISSLNQSKPSKLSDKQRGRLIERYRNASIISSRSERVYNLINDAVHLIKSDLSVPIKEKVLGALDESERALEKIKKGKLQAKMENNLKGFRALAMGDEKTEGIFPALENLFKEKDFQERNLALNVAISQKMLSQVESLVRDIRQEQENTLGFFEKTLENNRLYLLFIQLITVALALLVGWFFVQKYLIRRVKSLSEAMHIMSEGKLDTPINISGRDEISDMAKAVEVFRNYAIKAQKLDIVEKMAEEIQEKNEKLEHTVDQLKKAQEHIITREKLASLGQLTAGIAHEIKNPLNFINNFSLISKELISDLREEIDENQEAFDEKSKSFIDSTILDLKENLDRIHSHGKRTDDIIKGMLQHSRESDTLKKEAIEINRFVDSTINLAYQGKRASNSDFNLEFDKKYDESLTNIELIAQDLSRVILNLVTNSCDAIEDKMKTLPPDEMQKYKPCILVETKKVQIEGNDALQIRIRDNGPGVPEEIREKIMDPFFTTKETDKGTGLGLSMTHDLVTKNNGELHFDTEEGVFTEFRIVLPL